MHVGGRSLQSAVKDGVPRRAHPPEGPGSDRRHTAQLSWASCGQLPASSRAPCTLPGGCLGCSWLGPCWPIPQAPRASWTSLGSVGAAARASPHILALTGLRQRLGHLRVKCRCSESCWGDEGGWLPSVCGHGRGHAAIPRYPPGLQTPEGSHSHSMASSRSLGPRGVTHSLHGVIPVPGPLRGHTLTPRGPPGHRALEWPLDSARSQPWSFSSRALGGPS